MRHFVQAVVAALVTVGLAGSVSVFPPVAAAATPGEHLWHSWVFTSDVFEDEEAVAVAVAPGGYPVTVGTAVEEPGGDTDIRYVSHEADSSIWRWNAVALTWDGPAGGNDSPAGVVTDAAGNAYIAGTTTVRGGTTDIVVLKILGTDPGGPFSGDLLWARRYNGPAKANDEAEAIAKDGNGNIYVTGGSQRADGSWDVITVKFRPDGTRAWTKRHNNGADRFDRGLAIAVRGRGVYVAGVSRRPGRADDVVLIKYGLGGTREWVRYYDDALHLSETVTGIACTSSAVYICGAGKFTTRLPGLALLLKYDANGKREWVRYAGVRARDNTWSDVAVDNRGRVHLTGTLFRGETAYDIATAAYYPDGKLWWRAWFSSEGSRPDTGRALAVDSSGRTYVCGSIADATGDNDMVVLGYAADGRRQWHSRLPDHDVYADEANWGDDRANDIALVGGAAYVAGARTVYCPFSSGRGGDTTLNFFTWKIAR